MTVDAKNAHTEIEEKVNEIRKDPDVQDAEDLCNALMIAVRGLREIEQCEISNEPRYARQLRKEISKALGITEDYECPVCGNEGPCPNGHGEGG